MDLSPVMFEAIASSLERLLLGGRIRKVRARAPREIVIHVRASGEDRRVLMCAEPMLPACFLLSSAPSASPDTSYVQFLKKRVEGARIASVLPVRGDRIIEFGLETAGGPMRLICECIRGRANVVLVGGDGSVLDSMTRWKGGDREIYPGIGYSHPKKPEGVNPSSPVVVAEDDEALLARIEAQFETARSHADFESTARKARKAARAALKKFDRRVQALEQDMVSCPDPDLLRIQGELLKISGGPAGKGHTFVETENVFESGSPSMRIPLNPRLDLSQNIEDFFRRYRKAQNASARVVETIGKTRAQMERLVELDAALDKAVETSDAQSLGAIAEELGVRDPVGASAHVPAKGDRASGKADGLRRFVSADGIEILVGRDARGNEDLTLRRARGNDVWMHVDGFGGSHVVARVGDRDDVPHETLLDAAALAAFFSQARGKRVEVSWTHAKYVNKPRRAPRGAVSLSRRSSILVAPDAKRLERLLGKPPTFR